MPRPRSTLLKTGLPLWAEITLIVVVKLCLLWGAKALWFSHPLTHTHQMSVPQEDISRQILGTPNAGASSPIDHTGAQP